VTMGDIIIHEEPESQIPTSSADDGVVTKPPASLSRRAFLTVPTAVGLGALAERFGIGPTEASTFSHSVAVILQTDRPATPSGVASGDVTDDSAVVWSRTDRPCRMLLEWSTTSDFSQAQPVRGPLALPGSDFTARVDLQGLPSGQDIFYRVVFVDLTNENNKSEPVIGHLHTGPGATRRNLTFMWSGDTCGQGFGINPDLGGMRIFDQMLQIQPDFFIHSGDNIYADNPLEEKFKLTANTIWRNLIIPGKQKVAETIEEFRANYRYNYLDDNLRRFYGQTAVFAQWDDHEVRNNWFPGQIISNDPDYKVKQIDLLAAYANQAFHEYQPVRLNSLDPERIYRNYRYGPDLELFLLDERSYRGPNNRNRQPEQSAVTEFLGQQQLAWFKQSLLQSRATWKVVASDMAISLAVPDDLGSEAWANGVSGPPLGRELQLAEILKFIWDNQIQNIVWLTADVHYAAAHFYEPSHGAFADFLPFWEFVAGPLNAAIFPASFAPSDRTFGPKVIFRKDGNFSPPTSGLLSFGVGRVDATSRVLTIELHNQASQKLYSVDLEPHL
jgi:alkaline phosphatase D